MHPQKMKNVLALPAPERYDHFIKTVADRQIGWGLWADGWAQFSIENGNELAFPIWPERVYAELYVNDDWAAFEPSEIDIDDLLNELIPKLRDAGIAIAVFPTPYQGSVVPTLQQLEDDLRTELSRFE